jgi:CRISPR/Cas system CSM-associated protein Csm3 (group 7 of RAMP superfamily)
LEPKTQKWDKILTTVSPKKQIQIVITGSSFQTKIIFSCTHAEKTGINLNCSKLQKSLFNEKRLGFAPHIPNSPATYA